MTAFAGENTGFDSRRSSAYRRLLVGRQQYAKRSIRLNRLTAERSQGPQPASRDSRVNIIRVDFGGNSLFVANRLLRQAVRSTEDLSAALFWIGISAAAVLALGFFGA
jgi:hypothetical protein